MPTSKPGLLGIAMILLCSACSNEEKIARAICDGNFGVVQGAIESGWDPNESFSSPEGIKGMTPLTLPFDVASHCNPTVEMLKLLIEAGADVNRADSANQLTPLHEVALFGNTEMVKLLVRHGAKLDALDPAGQTPLMKAGSYEVVEFLIKSGADVSIVSNSGRTAYSHAVEVMEDQRAAALIKSRMGDN